MIAHLHAHYPTHLLPEARGGLLSLRHGREDRERIAAGRVPRAGPSGGAA